MSVLRASPEQQNNNIINYDGRTSSNTAISDPETKNSELHLQIRIYFRIFLPNILIE